MKTYHGSKSIESDIFFPIELNKLLENLLIKVHHYYRSEKDKNKTKLDEEKNLREIFSTILECPVLRDNIVWFNSWSRKPTGNNEKEYVKYKVRFIKDSKDSKKISRAIINISNEKEYVEYVSSLSALAKDYKYKKPGSKKRQFPLDYSYLISTENSTKCNIEMTSQYIKGFFVYLHFEKVMELFKDSEFNEHHNRIGKIASNGKKKEIIKILKKNYKYLDEHAGINEIIKGLTVQLSHAWIGELKGELESLIENKKLEDSNGQILEHTKHRKNIIRLINYFFWTKLAYPGKWNVLLYLPGVIAKEYGGVPLGVNIGLKEMVPLEVILFLKRAVLLFYTRKSVDFFEEKAENEAAKRIIEVNYLNRLLSDFQHTILQSIIESTKYFLHTKSNLADSYIDNLLTYISNRGTYLDQLSNYISTHERDTTPRATIFNLGKLKIEFIESGIFIRKISPSDDISEGMNKWKEVFNKIEPNIDINITGLVWGPIQTIIENLIKNSFDYAFTDDEKKQIYIRLFMLNNSENNTPSPAIIYWDNGKGFEDENCKDIPRWYKEGMSEDEVRIGKGYAYWLIGKIMEHAGGKLRFLAYANNNILKKFDNEHFLGTPDLLSGNYIQMILSEIKNLKEGNIRLIHILTFENQFWRDKSIK